MKTDDGVQSIGESFTVCPLDLAIPPIPHLVLSRVSNHPSQFPLKLSTFFQPLVQILKIILHSLYTLILIETGRWIIEFVGGCRIHPKTGLKLENEMKKSSLSYPQGLLLGGAKLTMIRKPGLSRFPLYTNAKINNFISNTCLSSLSGV